MRLITRTINGKGERDNDRKEQSEERLSFNETKRKRKCEVKVYENKGKIAIDKKQKQWSKQIVDAPCIWTGKDVCYQWFSCLHLVPTCILQVYLF